jgi:hypothetical protein
MGKDRDRDQRGAESCGCEHDIAEGDRDCSERQYGWRQGQLYQSDSRDAVMGVCAGGTPRRRAGRGIN